MENELWNGLPVVNGIAGKGIRFERIRRITGYLVGTVDRFNDAKLAEGKYRVKHVRMSDGNAVGGGHDVTQ